MLLQIFVPIFNKFSVTRFYAICNVIFGISFPLFYCFAKYNISKLSTGPLLYIIFPKNFTGEILAKFFRKIYRRSPCCSWGVSALSKRFVLCEQQVSLCRTRRLCLDCCFFIDIILCLTIYVDYHRNLEYAAIYC